MDISVEQLLEEEERKANARAARKSEDIKSERRPSTPFEGLAHRPRGGSRGGSRGGLNQDPQNRYSIEREENDERRSRRSRDLVEEDDVKDGSDKGSANGSTRSRRRSRSPAAARYDRRDPRISARDARHDPKDEDLAKYRDRGDYYHGGGFRRPSPGRDDDRYRPSRNGEREPSRRDSDNNNNRYRGRDRRRSPVNKKRTPEPTDDERDKRTVFVQQLVARLRTRELKEFFEQIGPVVEAQIVKDKVSGRSKGVGYVEFKDEESVEKAMSLTGAKLKHQPIIVQLTEAEKNRQARTTNGSSSRANGTIFHRLYVGNIHFELSEQDLRSVFEVFGPLKFVQLQREDNGRSKGYGFVQYEDPAHAKKALTDMNNFELQGRPIRVGLGSDKFTPESTEALLQRFDSEAQQQGSSFSGMGGRGAHAGGNANFDRASGKDAGTGGASALDDMDVSGVNFSNYSRDALMRKLARTDEPEAKIVTKTQPKKAPIEQQAPSRCVLLKHMFNQAKEVQDNPTSWQKDLEEDVKTECDEKYGIVVHVAVSVDSDDGEIYVKFDRAEGGKNAINGLNGRWFGGNMISAQYVVDHVYNMMFPAAASR